MTKTFNNVSELLCLTAFRGADVAQFLDPHGRSWSRFDRRLLDYLDRRGLAYIDLLPKHGAYYKLHNVPPKEYLDRLYVPPTEAAVCDHHNPPANHLFGLLR